MGNSCPPSHSHSVCSVQSDGAMSHRSSEVFCSLQKQTHNRVISLSQARSKVLKSGEAIGDLIFCFIPIYNVIHVPTNTGNIDNEKVH